MYEKARCQLPSVIYYKIDHFPFFLFRQQIASTVRIWDYENIFNEDQTFNTQKAKTFCCTVRTKW